MPASDRPTAPWEREQASDKANAASRAAQPHVQPQQRLLAEPRSTFFSRRFSNLLLRLGILAAVLALIFYCSLTFFPVAAVQAEPTEHITAQQIADALDVDAGDRLLYLPLGKLRQSLTAAIPWAADVTFVRKLPGTLIVRVQEAVPVVKVVTHHVAYLLDENCRVLDYQTAASCTDTAALTLVGLEIVSAEPGQVIDLGDDLRMRTLQTLMETFTDENELAAGMRILDLTSITDIGVVYEERLLIQIGDVTELEKKLALVAQVLPKLASNDVGYVYVRTTDAVRFLEDPLVGSRILTLERTIVGADSAAEDDPSA